MRERVSHTVRVAVVVGDGAGLLELAAPARVFADDEADSDGIVWCVEVVAGDPGTLRSTAGIVIGTPRRYGELAEVVGAADIVIVPSWRTPGGPPPRGRLLEVLRAAHERGAVVAGLCLGAFVLADAGLLDGRRVATHWRFADDLRARHPDVEVDPDVLYIDDGDILTSAGSAAGLDACLHLIRTRQSAATANAVARSLVVAPHRMGGQAQFVERPIPHPEDSDTLCAAMTFGMENLGDPQLDVKDLAARALVSRRTFDRRFRARTGMSPLQWLIAQRVAHAQRLLECGAELDVDEVARQSGFSDAVALRPHFRRILGVAPQQYRRSFAGR